MKAVLRFAKLSLLLGAVTGIMAATGLLAFGVILSWGFAGWSGGGALDWERKLDNQSGFWLLFLNGAHFFLSPLAAATAFNSRRTPDFTELLWPRVCLFFLLGAGLLISAIAVIAISLINIIEDVLLGWLRLLHLTNILVSFSTVVASVLSRLPRENKQSVYTLCFVHSAVATHTVVAVLFLGAITTTMNTADSYGRADALLIWLELSASLIVLGILSWRQIGIGFTLTGTTAAAVAFSGAWFCAPVFHGGNLYPGGWYTIPLSAVPLLLFLGIFLLRFQRRRLKPKSTIGLSSY